MEGFDGDRRGLKIGLTQSERNDVVSGEVEHLAHAGWLYGKSTVAKGAHGEPTPVRHLNAITISCACFVPLETARVEIHRLAARRR